MWLSSAAMASLTVQSGGALVTGQARRTMSASRGCMEFGSADNTATRAASRVAAS